MADEFDSGLSVTMDALAYRQRDLARGANEFAAAMTGAFARSVGGGRALDDVLKGLYLRLSDISLRLALKPLSNSIATGLEGAFSGLFGGDEALLKAKLDGAQAFADGGVIGTPSYFPMQGGLGLAGEAGPEAIMPLARGSDGKLGVASSNGGSPRINVQIVTPDPGSFRRSEAYVTGQIARAVARGQRGL